MLDQSKITELNKIAKQMVQAGKGILAADESTGTIGKKFEKIGLPNEETNRQAYREMLFTSPGIGEYISGVIMYDETIRQSSRDGTSFVSVLQNAGVFPGIKVDMGTTADPSSPNEKITKGLEGLPDRLKEYVSLGAKFAKWRAVITIANDLPTSRNIVQNARDLAQYALECQKAGLVPIVEPEVLMDGGHTMEKCREVSEKVLVALFEELKNAGVALEGMVLKTNMVISGKESGQKVSPNDIAASTLNLFKKVLPPLLPGQAFLSGGQSEIEATQNLNEINKLGPHPWQLTFSYGRALQDSAIKAWQGKSENVKAAQSAFLHRAKMNSLATTGKYESFMENN